MDSNLTSSRALCSPMDASLDKIKTNGFLDPRSSILNPRSSSPREPRMPEVGQLNPSPRILLGPGPSDGYPRVLTAMATPLIGHLDPQFLEIMNETQDMLRRLFRTKNTLTFPVSGTGSAGMETCVVNLIEPGDKMVVCVNGVFGQRMTDVAQRAGADVTTIERPWGEIFDLGQLRDVLKKVRPKVLGIIHAETSTGAWQPLSELGALCH